jgi:ribonucleoside-diphosphate reductase alpha chain
MVKTNFANLQPASLNIWDAKYRLKSHDGQVIDQTIDDGFQRVARALAEVETKERRGHWYDAFLWALRQGAIPAGRILANAGANDYKAATSTINCLAGETPVFTRQGIRPIRELAGKTVEILNGNGEWIEAPFKSFGQQPVYKLYFKWADRDTPGFCLIIVW